jgi:light-regulated signal transduction histidine kinase (bacteriophytochrome)
MEVSAVFAASALLQLVAVALQVLAAFYAFRLIRLTGGRTSWVLISIAFCIMALRRSLSLWRLLSGNPLGAPNLLDESVAVAISACMLAGVLAIAPLFQTIKQAAETLKRAKEDLEIKVAERTEELRDANAHLAVELDERRRAEHRMAQYADDLARSNAELEQFAYVASHDLQEPLRMVASFTQLLARRYRGKLDKDADEFIGFAVEGATRMQTLINDLLAYSRVGTRGKPLALTDSGAVLKMALDNLTRSVEESGATVAYGPLPTVWADEVQLTQLFQNLIANAIKFRGQGPPEIQILAAKQGSQWLFAVRDNGIGIAPEQQERIFSVFQRLHHRSEYPGTGIGLAICKKIVERHGGRLWVESRPGHGATFYFNLEEGAGHDRTQGRVPPH